jgi:hypothetical protein
VIGVTGNDAGGSDPLGMTFRINREPVTEPEKCAGDAGSVVG